MKNILEKENDFSYWVDSINYNSIDEIFNIPKELDIEDADPQKMVKPLIKNWHNHSLGKILEPIILKLLHLGKKYPFKKDSEEKDPINE